MASKIGWIVVLCSWPGVAMAEPPHAEPAAVDAQTGKAKPTPAQDPIPPAEKPVVTDRDPEPILCDWPPPGEEPGDPME